MILGLSISKIDVERNVITQLSILWFSRLPCNLLNFIVS